MEPTLRAGDHLIVRSLQRAARLPPCGSIVVCWHPRQPRTRIIKRLTGTQDGWMELLGDNPLASTDSRQFGLVDRSLLIGVVTAVLR